MSAITKGRLSPCERRPFSVSKTAFGKAESRLLQNHPYFTITVTLVKLYLVAFRLKPEGPSHFIM